MAQKSVILCEGPHDLILIRLILERCGRSVQSKLWGQIESCAKNTGEAVVISEFKGRRGKGISFLVKQDKNIDTCVESFWSLYQGFEGYKLKLVIDSDGEAGRRKVLDMMWSAVHKDVLVSWNGLENVFAFKGEDGSPAVFLYPRVDLGRSGKLTDIVKEAGFGNLAGCREAGGWERILSEYLASNPKWVGEFEKFLVG